MMDYLVEIIWLAILGKLALELWLGFLNRREILRHAGEVPAPFRSAITPETYQKAVAYSLAKGQLARIESIAGTLVLLAVLFSGLLPALHEGFIRTLGTGALAQTAFLVGTAWLLSLPSLPLEWYAQFRLEERFGFNLATQRTWWSDRVKGLALSLLLGGPLVLLLLQLVEWTGSRWWLWGWAALMIFQLILFVLAPVLILPLFNRFTPLPEGPLRDRLHRLGERAAFPARSIEVMDGSRRSRHSNAFFTGLGRFRKIVLYDTLISQLTEPELEAVLAHEIGHYRCRHILKMLAGSAAGMLAGFYLAAQLAAAPAFTQAFGFRSGGLAPALLLFSLLSGIFTFWLSPLLHRVSRHFEYEADRFAARIMGESASLTSALRKLNEKNLSNLTPHPLYSGFYYSHPTLREREQALATALAD